MVTMLGYPVKSELPIFCGPIFLTVVPQQGSRLIFQCFFENQHSTWCKRTDTKN